MATKCPYCGSTNVQTTNLGKRIVAGAASVAAGLAAGLFDKSKAAPTAMMVRRNICPKSEYICLNDDCKRKFTKE